MINKITVILFVQFPVAILKSYEIITLHFLVNHKIINTSLASQSKFQQSS